MFRMNLDKLNVDQKEVTAFVQQQMVELAPHLNAESPVQLNIAQGKKGYIVELTATHPVGVVQTVGRNKDIFAAIKNAKEGLLEYCLEIESSLNPENRDARIRQILAGESPYLH